MAFDFDYLDSILKKGFLNQHQIGSSHGCMCPGNRAKRENEMLGFYLEKEYNGGFEQPINKVRPKCSYIMFPDLVKSAYSSGLATHYGNVFAVFKDKIKDRSTFTFGDSSDRYAESKDVFTLKFKSEQYPHKDSSFYSRESYLEAQVWGELTVEDVDHFIVNCKGFENISNSNIEKLKLKTEKPVYSCDAIGNKYGKVHYIVRSKKL